MIGYRQRPFLTAWFVLPLVVLLLAVAGCTEVPAESPVPTPVRVEATQVPPSPSMEPPERQIPSPLPLFTPKAQGQGSPVPPTPLSQAPAPSALVLASPVPPTSTPLPQKEVGPTPTPTRQPSPAVQETPIGPRRPTSTPLPEPEARTVAGAGDMVYLLGESVYRGDYLGANGRRVTSIGGGFSWALHGNLLAYLDGSSLYVVDLSTGESGELRTLEMDPTSNPYLVWASDGRAILCMLDREDASAPTFNRSTQVVRIDPQSGRQAITLDLIDVMGVSIARYDGPSERMLLVPRGGDPSFAESLWYDALSGAHIATLPTRGEGEALASPDGHYLATSFYDPERGRSQIQAYDLNSNAADARIFEHESNTHSSSHVWSPDGARLAFLLRDGRDAWEATRGLGIWILDIASMSVTQIAEEEDPASGPVAWTPNGEYVVYYHGDPEGASSYYAVRHDGSDRRALRLEPQVMILGWIAATDTSS